MKAPHRTYGSIARRNSRRGHSSHQIHFAVISANAEKERRFASEVLNGTKELPGLLFKHDLEHLRRALRTGAEKERALREVILLVRKSNELKKHKKAVLRKKSKLTPWAKSRASDRLVKRG